MFPKMLVPNNHGLWNTHIVDELTKHSGYIKTKGCEVATRSVRSLSSLVLTSGEVQLGRNLSYQMHY